MPHRTLNLDEAARYLHLERGDVERLVKSQEIPHEKHGGRVVFRKMELESWASQRILGLEGRGLSEYHRKSSQSTRDLLADEALLREMLDVHWVTPALPAKTKASVLREMVKLAERSGRVNDPAGLLESLEAREELCSTGLPGGLALLHPRHPDPYMFESPILALGRSVQPIPFGAPDRRATDLFFLLGSSDERLHLHILARICVMAQKTQVLEQLRSAAEPGAMHDALLAAEQEVIRHAGAGV